MKKLLFIALLFVVNKMNAQIITTFAGNTSIAGPSSGDGGQATAAGFGSPNGVAVDSFGNLYITDSQNNRVRKVDTAGIITTFVGTGATSPIGDGGQATAATLNNPSNVICDANGNLYIADDGRSCIRKVNTAGIIITIAGNGTYGFSGDGGQATAASLRGASSVVFDAAGNFYITDRSNNRIRKVDTGGIITTFAGTGTAGYSGDGGQATAAQLKTPNVIIFDAAGNLYVNDVQNNVVRMINTIGIITTIAGNSTVGFSGDGGQATAAQISGPSGLAIDIVGNIFITDGHNYRVRMVNTAGVISTIAGDGYYSYGGDGGIATAAELRGPEGLAIDANDNLYIADTYNYVVRKVTNANQVGISQIKNKNEEVSVYPNPNNGNFVIETNQADKQTVQILDVTGKLILQQIISGKATIDASGLDNGIYFVQINTGDGFYNKKIIVQH